MQAVFNEEISCSIGAISFYPEDGNLIIFHCLGLPDMTGAISLARSLYPGVRFISCSDMRSSEKTYYIYSGERWHARAERVAS